MFDIVSRYITCGVQSGIPSELQTFMWDCIDELKKKEKELDYLQVFELDCERVGDTTFQKIQHRQEVPAYEKTCYIFAEGAVKAKIFVIDDGEYSTMLLAEEY